jgi:transposase-like protein
MFQMCLRSIRKLKKTILIGVVEYYLQGIFTRKMRKIMIALEADDSSASSISRITKELDKKIEESSQNESNKKSLTYL